MSTPERRFFSHIEGQHSAGLEFSIQAELVKQGMDQPSPEPDHPTVLTSRCSSPDYLAIRTCTNILALPP